MPPPRPLFAYCGSPRFPLLPPFPVTLCRFFNCPPLPCVCVCMAPLWLEIIECTVAPVAMEDSDHDVQSSSDEHDSCPTSPNHSRDHNADQVLDASCDLPGRSVTVSCSLLAVGQSCHCKEQLMGKGQLMLHYFYSLLCLPVGEVEKT